MSQDTETCAKCGELCGYDDNKGYWFWDTNLAICGRCKYTLINRFAAFFDLKNISYEKSGMSLDWPDINRILSRIKKDAVNRVVYIVSEKDYYMRLKEELIPIDEV